MPEYATYPKCRNVVKVYGRSLRISTKNSVEVCRAISGMRLDKAIEFLERLLAKKESLNGKYYTNVVKELLKLLHSAKSNAEYKNLDALKMIVHASAHKGFTFHRPRRLKLARVKMKITNIQVVLIGG